MKLHALEGIMSTLQKCASFSQENNKFSETISKSDSSDMQSIIVIIIGRNLQISRQI